MGWYLAKELQGSPIWAELVYYGQYVVASTTKDENKERGWSELLVKSVSHLWPQIYPCVDTTQGFSTLLGSPSRCLGAPSGAGKITSVLNFWTTAFRARLQRNTDHSWGRSFWPLTGLTRTMPLKHLCFHFLFWFECLRKRILLLGSWIPNIKDWVCVWVPKQSWPVSPYHQSCTLSTSAFRVQLFFPSLQKLFIIFLA